MAQIENSEKFNALRLIRSANIGVKTYRSLLKNFGSSFEAVKKIQSRSIASLDKLNLVDEKQIIEEIKSCKKISARIIHENEPDYPKLLKLIGDNPPFITIIGRSELLNQEKTISVVGSRNPSYHGLNFASQISQKLAQAGFTIVSGLARGIDSAAHHASVETGTIAVLAGGIDYIYPPENKKLYEEIAEKGCLIAENEIGLRPNNHHFPQRNRIVSGLSLGCLVIEASLRSGSLITARFASEQSREVFAVPGFPSDLRFSGNNYLLKNGAIIVEEALDVISNLDFNLAYCHEPINKKIASNTQLSIKAIDFEESAHNIELTDSKSKILSDLATVPVSIDVLAANNNLPIQNILILISELELEGLVKRVGNNSVIKV